MTERCYQTIMVGEPGEDEPKLTPSVQGIQVRVAEYVEGGVIVIMDTTDAQHAELIADPDISEHIE